MIALIITVIFVTLTSAFCSTMEAMLYSVPWTHIEKLREEKRPVGEILYQLRTHIDRPISAVLTLNTVANTAGSAIAGALAATALGSENLIWFTIFFTILILICGEILPKTFGVSYTAQLSVIFAYPLKGLIFIFLPFIYLSSFLTSLITKNSAAPETTDDDIRIMAKMSAETGGIEDFEERVITNTLSLDKKHVYEIMTPRTIVFSLPASMPIIEAFKHQNLWHFSRIPVYGENNEDILGIVSHKELSKFFSKLYQEEEGADKNATLETLIQPISFVPESQTLDKVLAKFLGSHQHLYAVLDEYGGLAGVISLEDVLEEMLGQEIVDESDLAPDLRERAKKVNSIKALKNAATQETMASQTKS